MAIKGPRSGYNPLTGAKPEYGNRAKPLLPNAADTSKDAQDWIKAAPMPFKSSGQPATLPAPPNSYVNTRRAKDNVYYDGGQPVNPNQRAGGYSARRIGVANTETTADMYAAVGEPRKPRGYNPIISGFPIPGPARKTGPDSQPRRKGRV